VANFGSYNKTYGSLGAIIGFMTWMWVSLIVVLVGAKLDDELERRSPHPPATCPNRECNRLLTQMNRGTDAYHLR
jgi:membrane protein